MQATLSRGSLVALIFHTLFINLVNRSGTLKQNIRSRNEVIRNPAVWSFLKGDGSFRPTGAVCRTMPHDSRPLRRGREMEEDRRIPHTSLLEICMASSALDARSQRTAEGALPELRQLPTNGAAGPLPASIRLRSVRIQ